LIKIPQEIEDYFLSTEISSSYGIMSSIMAGAGREYTDPYSDDFLTIISKNRLTRAKLRNCTPETNQFFSKYYSDAPKLIQVVSWAHEYAQYLYALCGKDYIINVSNQSAEIKLQLINRCEQIKINSISDFLNSHP